jgi:hypothetical protein
MNPKTLCGLGMLDIFHHKPVSMSEPRLKPGRDWCHPLQDNRAQWNERFCHGINVLDKHRQ